MGAKYPLHFWSACEQSSRRSLRRGAAQPLHTAWTTAWGEPPNLYAAFTSVSCKPPRLARSRLGSSRLALWAAGGALHAWQLADLAGLCTAPPPSLHAPTAGGSGCHRETALTSRKLKRVSGAGHGSSSTWNSAQSIQTSSQRWRPYRKRCACPPSCHCLRTALCAMDACRPD